jgi:predicted GNAT family acetyltransferase
VTYHDGRHILVRDGLTVAQAWDTRSSPGAVEVEVETHADHRRRGYARQVAAAWAARVLNEGKTAFYAHTVENEASAALARSLQLTWLSDEVEFQ